MSGALERTRGFELIQKVGASPAEKVRTGARTRCEGAPKALRVRAGDGVENPDSLVGAPSSSPGPGQDTEDPRLSDTLSFFCRSCPCSAWERIALILWSIRGIQNNLINVTGKPGLRHRNDPVSPCAPVAEPGEQGGGAGIRCRGGGPDGRGGAGRRGL